MVKEELRLRREMFYNLSTGHTDDFANIGAIKVTTSDRIAEDAIEYLTTNLTGEMKYPGKSYAIAFLYAHWLGQLGDDPLFINLMKPDLLNGDDPHFVPLDYIGSEIYLVYERILEGIRDLPDLHDTAPYEHLEYMMMTRNYFLEEFMLTKEQRKILPFAPLAGMHFRLSNISAEKIRELSDFWLGDDGQMYWVAVEPESKCIRIEKRDKKHIYVVGPNLFHSVPQTD